MDFNTGSRHTLINLPFTSKNSDMINQPRSPKALMNSNLDGIDDDRIIAAVFISHGSPIMALNGVLARDSLQGLGILLVVHGPSRSSPPIGEHTVFEFLSQTNKS